jgi:hypothetical protein
MNDLEIFVTGSSRPQLWPYFWESVRKMCIIRKWPKVLVHEDYVFPEQSDKVIEYVKKQPDISNVNSSNPRIGLGRVLTSYFKQPAYNSKYIFYLQEDWEFERPIDIDEIVWVMDQNPKINLIFFNKIRNNGVINKQKQTEYTFSNMKMCLYHSWTFLPGIWRADFVRQMMLKSGGIFQPEKPEGNFTNRAFGSHEMRTEEKYCLDNIGAFIYGRQGEHRYVRHLGNDWRMAAWQLQGPKRNVPGGNHNSDSMDKPYMAPWVPYPERPTSRGDLAKSKEVVKQMI